MASSSKNVPKRSKNVRKRNFSGEKIGPPKLILDHQLALEKSPREFSADFGDMIFRQFFKIVYLIFLNIFCISGIYQGHIPLSLIPEKGGLWYSLVQQFSYFWRDLSSPLSPGVVPVVPLSLSAVRGPMVCLFAEAGLSAAEPRGPMVDHCKRVYPRVLTDAGLPTRVYRSGFIHG